MWPSQRLASINLDSWQGKAQTRARDRHARRIKPIVTLLEERTLLSIVTLTVTTLADDPSGSIPGCTTLRDAINQANDSSADQETINFAVAGTIDLTTALPYLANNISLQGPGASDLTIQRDPSAGQFGILAVCTGMTGSISGMTISGGDAYSLGGITSGGGILNYGTLTVDSSVLAGNSAPDCNGLGGGICNYGSLAVTNSTFTGNAADQGQGGGICNGGTLTVTNSIFSNDTANQGGGICNSGYISQTTSGTGMITAKVIGSTFTNNSATISGGGIIDGGGAMTVSNDIFIKNSSSFGGGIFADGGSILTVTDSTFTNNFANDSITYLGDGGGIANCGTATVINSTFTDNMATNEGGAIFGMGELTVNNSTFTNNSATFGGGLYSYFGSATVTDGCFSSNLATDGGGIYNYDTLTVTNSTFANDSASDMGGGIYNCAYAPDTTSYNAVLVLTDCTISGNTSQNAGGGVVNASTLTATSTLTLDNTIVAGNLSTGTCDNDIDGKVQPASAYNLIGDIRRNHKRRTARPEQHRRYDNQCDKSRTRTTRRQRGTNSNHGLVTW